ncbi:MAG TPA: hypothetical protein VHN80_21585 [Kineosporiaceae bacterium]|nr:hypothetical protein [Kineosporiaceae bacterium]
MPVDDISLCGQQAVERHNWRRPQPGESLHAEHLLRAATLATLATVVHPEETSSSVS